MPIKKILYVEDDPDNQKLIRLFFRNEPYELITAETPGSAHQMLQEHSCDLIIVDLNLQGDGDGAELIRKIRSMPGYESIPVFVFSGFDESHYREYEIDNLVQRFFRKPTSRNTLIEAISDFDDTTANQT